MVHREILQSTNVNTLTHTHLHHISALDASIDCISLYFPCVQIDRLLFIWQTFGIPSDENPTTETYTGIVFKAAINRQLLKHVMCIWCYYCDGGDVEWLSFGFLNQLKSFDTLTLWIESSNILISWIKSENSSFPHRWSNVGSFRNCSFNLISNIHIGFEVFQHFSFSVSLWFLTFIFLSFQFNSFHYKVVSLVTKEYFNLQWLYAHTHTTENKQWMRTRLISSIHWKKYYWGIEGERKKHQNL